MKDTQALIDAVKAHARANYNTGAWDTVVEAYTASEIQDAIQGAKSEADAIRIMKRRIGLYQEKRRAIRNEIF